MENGKWKMENSTIKNKTQNFYNCEIPSNWKISNFGEIFVFLNTFSFSRENLTYEKTVDEIQYIHYGDIHAKFESEILDFETENRVPFLQDGFISKDDLEDEEFPFLKDGDLIIADASEDYEGICECVELKNINERKIISGLHTFAVRDENNKTALGFRTYLFNNRQVVRELRRVATGISVYGVSKTNLLKVKLPIPPIAEQKKIAEILSTWDSAIETCEKLIAAKISRKRALMQQLLTGKKRFPEFHGQKPNYAFLGDVASESTERNKGAMTSERLMAVMKTAGMIPMRERVQGESVERCKTVAPNWFAYNPMRLNIGSIAQWKGTEKVMVSGDYVVFKCDESKLDPDYLNHFRRSETWTNFVKTSGDGSVRVRIYFSHLAEMKMLLPSLEEQKRIAAVLNACDAEINLLTEKLEALKNQKRGLMQQLLTGKVRVRVEKVSETIAV